MNENLPAPPDLRQEEAPTPAKRRPGSTDRWAQALSWGLHPFLLPLYVLLILLFGTSYFSQLATGMKLYLLWVVALYTILIPVLSIGFFRSVGLLGNLSLNERRERVLPLTVGIVCYVLCALTVAKVPSLALLRQFFIAGACCEAVALVVTPFWKISLHLLAMGGVVALMLLLNIAGVGALFWTLPLFILLAGVLASARLQTGAHNPWQVLAGFCTGLVVVTLSVFFL